MPKGSATVTGFRVWIDDENHVLIDGPKLVPSDRARRTMNEVSADLLTEGSSLFRLGPGMQMSDFVAYAKEHIVPNLGASPSPEDQPETP